MSQRFVVTGTGRSGTGWCAETLRRAGLRVGWQDVFRHDHALQAHAEETVGFAPAVGARLAWGELDGDVSYEAVPLLRHLGPEVRVVLVVRDAQATIDAWLRAGAFGDDMSEHHRFPDLAAVLKWRFPGVLRAHSPRERAERYWETWNAEAARWAHRTLTLEGLQAAELLDAVGHGDRTPGEPVPPDWNHDGSAAALR